MVETPCALNHGSLGTEHLYPPPCCRLLLVTHFV